ncbi:hypothetical protein WH52_04570 [Tenacibaculum holothuriorum]|uniref:Outer membrane protein beta-barrel domain-containing protein n=1 Tax=Tenacibaculum holothuriorum TaxID=1635173 RepID=A0A1Y2PEN7_9FLAO|nr:outer membrane beta-barrel protein [Tenacibaculum holothuriorum]OSY88943.1 hypothetical protein WH52_04570 [Tenacibaculum holothuriorum]
MKKLTFTVLFLILSATAFSQTKLGAQLVYGTNTEFGAGAKAIFSITDKINLSPSINYYFGKSAAGVASTSFFEVNADAHYSFESDDKLTFYPLVGLNYTRSKASVSVLGVSASTSSFGVNLGGGLNYDLSSSITGLIEAKYVLGNLDQAVFTAGVLFNL